MSRALRLAPWQVWLVDFGQPIGHEQCGPRPAVVVGSATQRFTRSAPLGIASATEIANLDEWLREMVAFC
ncbi:MULTISPECIES: type II toxin-antitoxin system PemK/MazF family toxin [unclassified Frankia]|uniref:type II toxin-antitoxin system PemK/MazF family toxin n=1 Tax=unclassified Frankia TaxID=2632575 RepID=UPI002AD3B3E4|nr:MULTISPECIES: type II toxin-antitoxin system PemK/MazF family toxin [unclassified Frankia]